MADTTIGDGGTSQAYALGTFSDGSIRDITGSVLWDLTGATGSSVSNSAGSFGLITGGSTPGAATVTASAPMAGSGVSATPVAFTVIALEAVSLAITNAGGASSETMPLSTIGGLTTLTATITWSDGTSSSATAVTWSDSTTGVVTWPAGASATKVFTSDATLNPPGTTTVGATYTDSAGNTVSDTFELTVSDGQLTSITITSSESSVGQSATIQAWALGAYSDGSSRDITGDVAWGLTGATLSTISNAAGTEGLITGGTVAGAATITASAPQAGSGMAATPLAFTVTASQVTSITIIDPVLAESAAIPMDDAITLTARLNLSDGTTSTGTAVTWSNTSASVATFAAGDAATKTFTPTASLNPPGATTVSVSYTDPVNSNVHTDTFELTVTNVR